MGTVALCPCHDVTRPFNSSESRRGPVADLKNRPWDVLRVFIVWRSCHGDSCLPFLGHLETTHWIPWTEVGAARPAGGRPAPWAREMAARARAVSLGHWNARRRCLSQKERKKKKTPWIFVSEKKARTRYSECVFLSFKNSLMCVISLCHCLSVGGGMSKACSSLPGYTQAMAAGAAHNEAGPQHHNANP